MKVFILFGLLSGALYYLSSRALITQAIWSRYPKRLAILMDCAACSGFWYGVILAITIGRRYALSYLGLDPFDLWTPVIVGFGSLTMTPIVAGIMQAGFEQLGSAVDSGDGGDGEG